MNLRLFVAIDLPESVTDSLERICTGLPGARWIDPDQYHLTLRFIGEVENGVGDDLDAALAGISAPAFDLTLSGVGHFGKAAAARILWAGAEPNDALNHLQAKIETAVMHAGLPAEQRRFSPHVTLARLKRAPGKCVEQFVSSVKDTIAPIKCFIIFISC